MLESSGNNRGLDMQFPLALWDLIFFLGTTTVILLIAATLVSLHYGQPDILIDRKKLNRVALILCTLFLFAMAARVFEIMIAD